MIPVDQLSCARDLDSARHQLEKHPEFDIIPIRHGERIVAFLQRGSDEIKPLQLSDVISEGTSILDLVDCLGDKRHFFIIARRTVVGFVHFSDLNDPVVKLPFFVLLEAVERHVADSVRALVNDDNIASLLDDPKRRTQVSQKMAKMREQQADRDWVTLLYFKEILVAASRLHKLDLPGKDIDLLSKVRTLVCHAATEPLVEKHDQVKRLTRARRICAKLLTGKDTA
jgi:hypothetical protein